VDEDEELAELLDVIKPIPKPPIAPARIPISASMMTLSNIEPLLRPINEAPFNQFLLWDCSPSDGYSHVNFER